MKKLLPIFSSLVLVTTLSVSPVSFAGDTGKHSCTSLLSDTHCLQELTKNILTSEKGSLLDVNIVNLEKTLAILKRLGIKVSGSSNSTY